MEEITEIYIANRLNYYKIGLLSGLVTLKDFQKWLDETFMQSDESILLDLEGCRNVNEILSCINNYFRAINYDENPKEILKELIEIIEKKYNSKEWNLRQTVDCFAMVHTIILNNIDWTEDVYMLMQNLSDAYHNWAYDEEIIKGVKEVFEYFKWKTNSKNTTEYIYLHDCLCNNAFLENKKLTLEMDYMEILDSHPENPHNQAHQTGKGRIEFNGIIILKADIYRNNKKTKIKDINNFEIEILDYDEIVINEKYKYAKIFGEVGEQNDWIDIKILFENSMLRWNELKDVSWFEDEKWKTEINIDEVLNMISSNNPKEIQEEGIKLASNIKFLGNFFNPIVTKTKQDVLENCAKIIYEKSDEEISPYLFEYFLWIKNFTSPGAKIIAERLRKYKNKNNLKTNRKIAIKIAKIIGDKQWLKNIRSYNKKI